MESGIGAGLSEAAAATKILAATEDFDMRQSLSQHIVLMFSLNFPFSLVTKHANRHLSARLQLGQVDSCIVEGTLLASVEF